MTASDTGIGGPDAGRGRSRGLPSGTPTGSGPGSAATASFPEADSLPRGILPVLPPGTHVHLSTDRQDRRSKAATAASAAGVRAFTAQAVAFYFRAPVKAFFRTRVDYLAYARNIHQQAHQHRQHEPQHWLGRMVRGSTPSVLASAVRHSGWRVVPEQVLPPLIANVGVGAVLYTSYLHILGRLHEESSRGAKRVYPPPEPSQTFLAGLLAGAIQSFAAAPLDAIQARYEGGPGLVADGSRSQSMWSFSAAKLREIGLRGIFAGWGLSLAKDSLGSAVFFSTFEVVKAQGYYSFVKWYYGSLGEDILYMLSKKRPTSDPHDKVIRPHYAIEPAFLMVAGITASFAQQLLLHPLTHIQMEHWEHLEALDAKARKIRQQRAAPAVTTTVAAASSPSPLPSTLGDGSQARTTPPEAKKRKNWRMFRAYYHAYQETWAQCLAQSAAEGRGLVPWLFRGFWWNTIRQVPSTSAGLIIFELVRRKYGFGGDQVRITTSDGYDILLR